MENLKKIFDSFDTRGMIELNRFMELKFKFRYDKKAWDWENIGYDETEDYEDIEDAPRHMTIIVEETYQTYFMYEEKDDLILKILSYLSRPASKEGTQSSRRWLLDGINKYLGTSFSKENIRDIYTHLGNNVNSDLCEKFIKSDYDMKVLEGK